MLHLNSRLTTYEDNLDAMISESDMHKSQKHKIPETDLEVYTNWVLFFKRQK